jgi:hypothetical protein
MPLLELLGLVLVAPGAIVALHELRALRAFARARARPRVTELDLSIRFSIRRR